MRLKKDLSIFSRAALMLLLMLLTTTAWAVNVNINGIVYTLNNDALTAMVGNNTSYSETSVTIPATIENDSKTYSVTSIGDEAFIGCSNLTSIDLPASVTSIGNKAFYNCSNLTSITIPASVTSIGGGAFDGCTNLNSVTFAANSHLTSIGNNAFYNCSNLASIDLPASVTSIGGDAFNGTGWYKDQPNGLLYLGNWLQGYKGDKPTGPLSIKDDTRGIAVGAFNDCSGLTSVTIPNSVTTIEGDAFQDCI